MAPTELPITVPPKERFDVVGEWGKVKGAVTTLLEECGSRPAAAEFFKEQATFPTLSLRKLHTHLTTELNGPDEEARRAMAIIVDSMINCAVQNEQMEAALENGLSIDRQRSRMIPSRQRIVLPLLVIRTMETMNKVISTIKGEEIPERDPIKQLNRGWYDMKRSYYEPRGGEKLDGGELSYWLGKLGEVAGYKIAVVPMRELEEEIQANTIKETDVPQAATLGPRDEAVHVGGFPLRCTGFMIEGPVVRRTEEPIEQAANVRVFDLPLMTQEDKELGAIAKGYPVLRGVIAFNERHVEPQEVDKYRKMGLHPISPDDDPNAPSDQAAKEKAAFHVSVVPPSEKGTGKIICAFDYSPEPKPQ